MSPLVEIVGVGAQLPSEEGRSRPRMVFTGAVVDVDDETAERLIADGVGRPAGEDVAVEQTVTPEDPADVPLEKLPIGDLRKMATERDIPFDKDTKKPALAELIRAADLAEDDEDLPEDLSALTDDELLELAGDWAIEPGDADRDALLAKLTAHRATLNTGENDG